MIVLPRRSSTSQPSAIFWLGTSVGLRGLLCRRHRPVQFAALRVEVGGCELQHVVHGGSEAAGACEHAHVEAGGDVAARVVAVDESSGGGRVERDPGARHVQRLEDARADEVFEGHAGAERERVTEEGDARVGVLEVRAGFRRELVGARKS